LNRIKYRNLFLFAGQFRYVSTATSKETVENFDGNNIDTVESWKVLLKHLDKQVFTYYVRKGNGDSLRLDIAPIPELLKQIKVLNESYCFLVSVILKQNYNVGVETRLFSNNIPKDIEKIQQLFIESPAIRLLAIQEVKNSSGSVTPGIDNVSFTSLKKKKQEYVKKKIKSTRYFKSSKNFKVKKDLPKVAIIDKQVENSLRENVLVENSELCWSLYKKCNIKSLRKNYRGSTIRRVWIPKPGSSEFRPLGIPTLRDRVLQTIIHMALLPIAEWQSDNFSFGFRPKRSAIQPISMIADQLRALGTVQPYRGLPKEVSYERYKKHKGLKHCVRSHLISKGANKRRRKYSYTYWIINKEVKNIKSRDTFYAYPRFINVDIEKCFDRMSHSSILKYTPIVNKYRFLLKAWLYAPIYGTRTVNDSNIVKIIPKRGVPQGSIIGPLTCNFVLDGLEEFLLKDLPLRYQFDDKEINRIRQQFGQEKVGQYKNYSDWPIVRVRVYRYADDILILGKASQEHFMSIYKRLVLFLKDRGLSLKGKEDPVEVFLPEAKFEFLGFQFQFANYKNSKINRGKYTRYSFSEPFMVLRGLQMAGYRDGLFITIRSKSYKSMILKFKLLFARNRVGLPVETLIKDYNKWLIGVVTYFGITRSTRIQLMKLNHFAYFKFKKLLLRKFSSKPKLRTFLREKYFTSDYLVKDGYTIQLKVQDVIPHGGQPLHNLAPTISSLKANIYLDSSLYIENNQKKILTDARQKLLMNRGFNAKEFRLLLHTIQKGKCSFCNDDLNLNEIHLNSYTQIDHLPRIHSLKFHLWCEILENLGIYNFSSGLYIEDLSFKNLNKENLKLFLVKPFNPIEILDQYAKNIGNDLQCRLVHASCNKEDGKIASKKSAAERRQIKMLGSEELYARFLKFGNVVRSRIRSNYRLQQNQKNILFKNNKS
jgi:retron-type reverse transcriptase